jgi:hypothetical protein
VSIQDKIRKLAKEFKLAQVNFLDSRGRYAKGLFVTRVQMQFSNGEWVECTISEFQFLGRDVVFKIMSTEEWISSGLNPNQHGPDGGGAA